LSKLYFKLNLINYIYINMYNLVTKSASKHEYFNSKYSKTKNLLTKNSNNK